MRYYYIVFFCVLQWCDGSLFAQEEIKLNVIYKFEYARDAENKSEFYTTDMILSLGKQSSRYTSVLMYNDHDPRKLKAHRQLQKEAPSSATVVIGSPGIEVNNQGVLIKEEVIKKFRKNQMFISALVGLRTYSVETKIPRVHWSIKSDKKTIGGFSVQKAVGTYGGRTYVAWFTPELPFRDGPWKLSGLPGLILEAHDRTNEIRFMFKEITRNTDSIYTTAPFLYSQFSIRTDLKSYNKVKTEFEKNPLAVMSAQAPNTTTYVLNIENPDSHTVKVIKKYNPMELTLPTTN